MAMVLKTVVCKGWLEPTMYRCSFEVEDIAGGPGGMSWWWYESKKGVLARGRGGRASEAGGWVHPLFWYRVLKFELERLSSAPSLLPPATS